MDHRFLEFWGNLLLQMAQGQKQSEEVIDWWQKGFAGFNEFNVLLGKVYGLKPPKPESQENDKVWEEGLRTFQKSFQDYFSLFGYVPRTEYDRLQKEYEDLKKKLEIQEEAIRQLQTLLAAQTMDPAGMAKPLKDLISEQTNQFQRLMAEMMPNVKKPPTGEDEGQ
jgi:hypothetical protein